MQKMESIMKKLLLLLLLSSVGLISQLQAKKDVPGYVKKSRAHRDMPYQIPDRHLLRDIATIQALIDDEEADMQWDDSLQTFIRRNAGGQAEYLIDRLLYLSAGVQSQAIQSALALIMENFRLRYQNYITVLLDVDLLGYLAVLHAHPEGPYDNIATFFRAHPVENVILPLYFVLSHDASLQDAFESQRFNAALEQYSAVLQAHSVLPYQTMEAFFAAHPVENPILSLDEVRNESPDLDILFDDKKVYEQEQLAQQNKPDTDN